MRRIILGSPVPTSAKVNLSELHSSNKGLDSKDKERHQVNSRRSPTLTPPSASHKSQEKLDTDWEEDLENYLSSDTIDTDELEAEMKRQKRKKNKKDKKHKRSRKSKKRKKKRTKSFSSIEPISDNDLDEVIDSRHYTPPAVGVIAAKSPSDPTYTPIKQHSPRSSDTPPPIRPDSSNSYYSETANMTVAAGVASSTSSAATNNKMGLQVTVTNRMGASTRHRTPPRTSNSKNRFPNPHSPHTPPLYAGGSSSSVSGREVRSSRFVMSPAKDEHRHHHHHHGRPDIAGGTPGNHHYHSRQAAAVSSDSHKYKDTDRYYHHQPSTPPHKKRKMHDVRNAGNTQGYYGDHGGRHDSRSSSRNMRANEYDRYSRDNYAKRYSRYVWEIYENVIGLIKFLRNCCSFIFYKHFLRPEKI